MSAAGGAYWLPRALHPLAWWLWALGLTVAASRTTNPLLLSLIIGVVCWVVMARRPDAPWAHAFRLYLIGGLVVVLLRVLFRIVFAGNQGEVVLVPLPTLTIGGFELFGDITAESLLAGLYDGLRLATMLLCLGAANALANPRRLLRSMPPALHEVSTAVVVALSVFPQLAESVGRVRRARRLRPTTEESRFRALHGVVIPVLEDALDRSLLLAASMDARGYGRTGDQSRRRVRLAGAMLVTGLAGICVGVYCLVDATTPRVMATPLLLVALAVGAVGVRLSANGVQRTVYRPDSWRAAELLVVLSGASAGVVVWWTSRVDPNNLNPSLNPLTWPEVSLVPVLGILLGLLPAFLTPAPAPMGVAVA